MRQSTLRYSPTNITSNSTISTSSTSCSNSSPCCAHHHQRSGFSSSRQSSSASTCYYQNPLFPLTMSSFFVRCNRWIRQLAYHRMCRDRMILGTIMLGLIVLAATTYRGGETGGGGNSTGLLGMTRLSKSSNLERLNEWLNAASLDEVLLWAHQVSDPGPVVQVSSFGASGMVILHKLQELKIPSQVISIDTLHLFPETYSFIEKTMQQQPSSIKFQIYQPDKYTTQQAFDQRYGHNLYQTNPEQYAYYSKVEPLQRALAHHKPKLWITGRRQSQGGERIHMPILEWDDTATTTRLSSSSSARWKLNPLAHWTYDQVWDYIKQNNIPYNPLYDQGYKSIGDTMTTQPSGVDGSERSGRFVGLSQTECGIHSTREKLKQIMEQPKASSTSTTVNNQGKLSRIGEVLGLNKQPKEEQVEQAALKHNSENEALPCTGCLELDPKSLQQLIEKGTTDVLIEFHSPLCGHCRHFAPTYEQVALALQQQQDSIQVARFDITYNNVPKSTGIVIQSTPTMIFLKRLPEQQLIPYTGNSRTHMDILKWLSQQTDYIHI